MRGPTTSYILFELVGVSTIRHRVVSNQHFRLQFAIMDKIHREVLAKKTTDIMGRISNPRVFSVYLREIFSAADIEAIAAKEDQKGAIYGTQTMLAILEKRGPKAYGLFVTVLRNPEFRLDDLADELEAEECKLRGKPGISFVDLFTLNTIQSRHASLLVGQRKIPSFSQTSPVHKNDFIPTKIYLRHSLLNIMKAIELK